MRRLFSRGDRRGQRGNAMIEFAVAASFLTVTFAGTFQFGYAFFAYNNLLANVRAGARYASVKAYNSTTTTPTACFVNDVRRMVVYGDPDATSGTPVTRGLTTDKVNVVANFLNGTPDSMTVSISNYEVDAVFGRIRLNNKPSVTFPFLGIYQPIPTACE